MKAKCAYVIHFFTTKNMKDHEVFEKKNFLQNIQ